MRTGLLAALTVLLTGHGLALAQQPGADPTGSPPTSYSPPNLFLSDPVACAAHADVDVQARTSGFWGSAEYLAWWFKNGGVPPLVTAGGNGVPASPGTQVLLDNLDFADDFRQGGRFTLGYHFETTPSLGVEASYFFLSDRHSNASFSSSGDPTLGQPFIDVDTGQPNANLVAAPGIAAGTVTIGTSTALWGAEANLTAGLTCSDRFHLTALGGFRFLRLDDELTSGEHFQISPNVPGFGGNRVNLLDTFRTVNRFYGGQVGLQTGVRLGPLTLDFRGKIALGQMHQDADVVGATNVLSPDGSTRVVQGGLYALRTNGGRQQRDQLAFIPEVGLNLGLPLTDRLKLTAGYSFLWINNVARAGDQIDPVLNMRQIPIKAPPGPLVGPARPAFNFDGTDFWAQGLNFGLELRY